MTGYIMSDSSNDANDDTDTQTVSEDAISESDADQIGSEAEAPSSNHNSVESDTAAADSTELGTDDQDAGPATKGPDEVYCTSCGEAIKEQAEVCPHCGVRQSPAEGEESSSDQAIEGTGDIPQGRAYELQKVARKDITTVMLVSFLLTPAGYWMVGKTGLAIVNFLTFNYFLLGFLIVPFHTRKIINDARDELNRNDVGW